MSFNYTYKPSTNSLDVTTPDNANVTINSGDNGSATGDGGDLTISASDGGNTSGDGGDITLQSGSVTSGTAGDVNISPGLHSGGGTDGKVNILGDGYTSNNFDITGSLTASGITYPLSDGSNGQAIITDGSGNLSFASGLMSYTVGTSASGARFSTIQAAIDQAVSDGADANNPAEIIIFPGFYSENITANNGGIALSGIANEWGVFISGTITFTNDGSASNIWMLSNIGVSGAISVNGTSGGSFLALEIENCSLFGQVSVADASAQIRVKSSKIVTNSADPIVVNNTTSAKPIRLFDSKITGAPAGRALLISAGDIRNCSIVGHVEVTDNTSFNCLVGTCIVYTSGNPGFITNNSSNIVEITNCTISRTGSAGTLISKSGSGELQRSGNSFLGNVTDPPVTISAGTDTVGNYIEREFGPYSFPTSSTNVFSMPGTDGSSGQALVTDGAGNLSFSTVSDADISTLAETLNAGNTTDGYDIIINNSSIIVGDETSANGGDFTIRGGHGGTGGAGDGGEITVSGGDGYGAPGGNITLTGGDAIDSAGTGGNATLAAGDGIGSSQGGIASLFSGDGGNTGDGGEILITAGNGGSTSGNGGDIDITSGGATGSSPGDITISIPTPSGTAAGGRINVVAGDGNGAPAGNIFLSAGSGTSGVGVGGNAQLSAGDGAGSSSGGNTTVDSGDGGATGDGGDVKLNAGSGGTTSGDSGNVVVTLAAAAGSGANGDFRIVDSAGSNTVIAVDDTTTTILDGHTILGDEDSANGGGFTIRGGNGGTGGSGSGGEITVSGGDGYGAPGGNITLTGGDAIDSAGNGGNATLAAGDGIGSSQGGIASLFSGDGGDTGDGGPITITAGNGGSTSGNGGDIDITSGGATGSSPGDITISIPTPSGTAAGGRINVIAGDGNGAPAGVIFLSAGDGTGGAGTGGTATLSAGNGDGSSSGGSTTITSGNGGATGDGGDVSITSGSGGTTSGISGNIVLNGGDNSGSGDAGNIHVIFGNATSGNNGKFIVKNADDTTDILTASETAGQEVDVVGNIKSKLTSAANFTIKIAPNDFATITDLADGYDTDNVVTLSEDGIYNFTVVVTVKGETTGNYYQSGAEVTASRNSGTLTIEGDQSDLRSARAGLSVILTASSGDLNVNVQNDTGEQIDGRIKTGWSIEDVIT